VTKPENLQIRQADPEDCVLILNFIKALAKYEKLLHEVVATEEALAQTLFGERPGAEALIAEWSGQAAGFALYFPNYSTFLAQPGIYLEDLFVHPGYRGHGIGKSMLSHLAAIAVSRNCGRLDWSVLNWNEPAIGFYQSIGARAMNEWTQFRLSGQALQNLAGKS
jgi:GNAT superfamily N-acetyltransferase